MHPSKQATKFTYVYHNPTSVIQMIRLVDDGGPCIERMVPPNQEVCFEASSSGYLEIQPVVFTHVLSPERVACAQLAVQLQGKEMSMAA